jgi:hypothetical protein
LYIRSHKASSQSCRYRRLYESPPRKLQTSFRHGGLVNTVAIVDTNKLRKRKVEEHRSSGIPAVARFGRNRVVLGSSRVTAGRFPEPMRMMGALLKDNDEPE